MFSIGLHNPKNPINVGHVLRAADAYGASMVAIAGKRIRSSTNVSGAEYRIPIIRGDDLRELIPFGCVPVGVDLVDSATDVRDFIHPPNAFYVFGAEDATLGEKVLSWCKYKIYVPTRICMNLSACVNVICYDRISKIRLPNATDHRDRGKIIMSDQQPPDHRAAVWRSGVSAC